MNRYEVVLKQQIDEFINALTNVCSINSKRIIFYKTDYPIFKPANSAYFEYKHFEDILERYIREFLITPVFTKWLTIAGFHCKILKKKDNRYIVRTRYSNSSFGEEFTFAFSIEHKGKQIAYRYSSLCFTDEEIAAKMKRWNIDHFEIIDWSDTTSLQSTKENYGVSLQFREKVRYVTLQNFLISHFNEDLASLYLSEIQNAVKKANQLIGFQTIPMLSLKHLSEFKSTILTALNSFPLGTTHYVEFSRSGELTSNTKPMLSSSDLNIITERCFRDMLFHALIGNEKFARCFMTSEYLFQLFKVGNQHFFDYSTVVSGFFKSIEILLEKLMILRLSSADHDTLWIKAKIGKRGYKGNVDGINCRLNPATKEKQVAFIARNKRFFSNEMAPLIWFLHDDENSWYVSDNGKDIIHACLLNYSQGCRNEHLHKDIIDDLATMEAVRNNTILCLLYLLGGRKITSSVTEDYSQLGASGDSYARLYKAIDRIPKHICVYYLQFDNHPEQRAIRLYDQEDATYDSLGNLISKIVFVKSDSPTSDDFELSTKQKSEFDAKDIIELSPAYMPQKMWWYNRIKGRKEIQW